MGLKTQYDSEDAVPAEYRGLFTEKDGKFLLTGIDGIKTQGDVDALKGSLDKERGDHKKTKEALKKLDGIEAEKYQADQEELESLRAQIAAGAGQPDQKKIDALVEAGVNRIKGPLERDLTKLKLEKEALEGNFNGLKGENTRMKMEQQVRTVAEKVKLLPSAIEDVVALAPNMFTIAEDGKVVTKEGVGVTPNVTLDSYFEEMKDKRGHWWAPSQGGGSGGGGAPPGNFNDNPWVEGKQNRTRMGQILQATPDLAKRMAAAAGVDIHTGKKLNSTG